MSDTKPKSGPVMPGGIEYQAFLYAVNRDQNLARAAANWRKAFFLCFVCCFLSISFNYWQSTQSKLVPYVVEVKEGEFAKVKGPATQTSYMPEEAQVKYFLWQFVHKFRSIPQDTIVLRQNWSDAYAFLNDATSVKVRDYMQSDEVKKSIGHQTSSVVLRSITKASEHTFQIRWTETRYTTDGKVKDKSNMYGLFTFDFTVPQDETILRVNPLGVVITDLSWSKEL